jgi:acyl-CoA thioester hydrolase
VAAQTHSLRVRYGESDQMGVAHHGAYVAWCEAARIEWLRTVGHSYRQLEADGVFMPVVELNISYRRSLRFDDEAELSTTAIASGPSRVQFTTEIACGGKLCAIGVVTVACLDRNGRPQRIPAAIADLLKA